MAEEEKKKKRPHRRDYLNDFKLNVAGEYVYTGKVFHWTCDRMRTLALFWGLSLGACAAAVAGGCIPGTGMEGSAWVLLPYVVSLICSFTCLYAVGRLAFAGEEVREYVFKGSVEKLPLRTLMTAIFSAIAVLAELVNLFLPFFRGKIWAGLLLMALEAAICAATILLRRAVVRLEWTQ